MTTHWVAVLREDPGSPSRAAARLRDADGRGAGLLVLWEQADRPHECAVQVDPRLHDPTGPECVISLALAPPHARPIADDPAVVDARRAVLRDGRPCAVTLLTADPVLIAGALTVARADRPDQVSALHDDPFARLWPARLLTVDAGLLGTDVRPTGPSVERYAGQPWPFDRFPPLEISPADGKDAGAQPE